MVVGGSIAALVAADRLAAAGDRVDLHLPERGLGGGFLPLSVKGRRLELGARLVELSYDDEPKAPPPFGGYVPGPHGHRPFLAPIDAFVRELAGDDLVQVTAPEVSVDGRRCTDYVLSGDLSGLADAVDDAERAAMADEAARCVEAVGPHGWFTPEHEADRWRSSFADMGRAHTGPRFHERLIESLAAKILPGGTASVIGALHRKIWLPLFHPVTAWEACTGSLSYRPQRAMYSLASGGMGAIVQRLVDRVDAAPEVHTTISGVLTAVNAEGDDVHLGFEDGTALVAHRPVLGVGAEELFAAAGIGYEADRVVATMVWVDVAETQVGDLPSVLFATEADVPAFRVTDDRADARPGVHTLCCELDHRLVDPEDWERAATDSLRALGVITQAADPEIVLAASRPSFATPSAGNREAFAAARRALDQRALPASVVGGATAFGADTFNEQVVQGLAVAEAVSRS